MDYVDLADEWEKQQKRERHKVAHKAWRSKPENHERWNAAGKAWNERNPERRRAICKAWRERNTEYYRELKKVARHRYRTRVLENGGSFTAAEWMALKNQYGNRCLCCNRKVKLTPDHVIPISKGGSNSIDNIQPLCQPCNSRKSVSCIDYRGAPTAHQFQSEQPDRRS